MLDFSVLGTDNYFSGVGGGGGGYEKFSSAKIFFPTSSSCKQFFFVCKQFILSIIFIIFLIPPPPLPSRKIMVHPSVHMKFIIACGHSLESQRSSIRSSFLFAVQCTSCSMSRNQSHFNCSDMDNKIPQSGVKGKMLF